MLSNDQGEWGIERVYSIPEDAGRFAEKMKGQGATRTEIEPLRPDEGVGYVAVAWFPSVEAARAACV